jgi:hypothetical protein
VCLPLLRRAQNPDGGWGFHPGSSSRAEPTCWALLALAEVDSPTEIREAGFHFLRQTQLPDGSWPASASQNIGCWATSLASWALLKDVQSRAAAAAGLRWICEDWPRDNGFFRRMIRALFPQNEVSAQDNSLRGWGWTPQTASWVEPTAFALIVLDQAPAELLPRGAAKRRRYGRALLRNRMCPGGGWNCGNPMVYGVPGAPLMEPTVWALLALRDEPDRPESVASLKWLEQSLPAATGAGSLALGKICLETFGRQCSTKAPSLSELYMKNEFLRNVPVMAWTCLALSSRPTWLSDKAQG